MLFLAIDLVDLGVVRCGAVLEELLGVAGRLELDPGLTAGLLSVIMLAPDLADKAVFSLVDII